MVKWSVRRQKRFDRFLASEMIAQKPVYVRPTQITGFHWSAQKGKPVWTVCLQPMKPRRESHSQGKMMCEASKEVWQVSGQCHKKVFQKSLRPFYVHFIENSVTYTVCVFVQGSDDGGSRAKSSSDQAKNTISWNCPLQHDIIYRRSSPAAWAWAPDQPEDLSHNPGRSELSSGSPGARASQSPPRNAHIYILMPRIIKLTISSWWCLTTVDHSDF